MAASPQQFIFNNNADGLYPLTEQVIGHIAAQTNVGEMSAFKLKMVLIELLTNSIKHSGGEQTIINVAVSGDTIKIQKSDNGKQLGLVIEGRNVTWPLPVSYINKAATVYTDGDCTLQAVIRSKTEAEFFIQEQERPAGHGISINNLSEHFGLMIITRASKRFTYDYNEAWGTNNFTATLAV